MELNRTAARRGSSAQAVTAALAAAAVTALLMVTAIASRDPLSGVGQTVAPPGGGTSQVSAPPWALALVAAGALIALAAVVVAIRLRVRRGRQDEPPPAKDFRIPWAARVVALLIPVLLGAALVVAAIEGSHLRSPTRYRVILPERAARPITREPARPSSFTPPTWILPVVLAVVLGGSGAVVLALAFRGRLAGHAADRPAMKRPGVLEKAVDASLDELRTEPDPRLAVIGAYRRMEATLAAAGLPRRASEAPREYSGRAHNHLELSARPLEQLTTVFERARFGVGRVGEPLRDQAIAALLALREELGT